tara:strand:- start:20 stop:340 length:321 start_codon:yes stop_codon:yes gene_type:complete
MKKKSTAITKVQPNWLWPWVEPESLPTVLPKSRTQRLALKAKLANVDAEKALDRAYKIEIARTKVVGEAMFKTGKALRYSFVSQSRDFLLRIQAARRQYEPNFRNK